MFRVKGLGFRVWSLGGRVLETPNPMARVFRFRISDFGLRTRVQSKGLQLRVYL